MDTTKIGMTVSPEAVKANEEKKKQPEKVAEKVVKKSKKKGAEDAE